MSLLAPERPVTEPPQADLLIREARRRQRRRRLAVTGLVFAVLGAVAIVATTGSLASQHAPQLARPVHRPAVGRGGGPILHIDVTSTQTTTGHPTYVWEQDLYEQTSSPYLSRTIDKRLPGTPPGTEGVGSIGSEETYDPTNNTIYDPGNAEGAPGDPYPDARPDSSAV